MKPQLIAPGVWRLNIAGFVNCYFVQTGEDWALIDAGLAVSTALVEKTARELFGEHAPTAILLTHTHFDHAGGAYYLAKFWKAPIYVHRLEKPYVTGQATHPPQDPTVGGALALLSRAMPRPMFNLTGLIEILPADGSAPGLAGWQTVETPGHAPGHVSFWNEEKRVLIAGDALATADFDSWVGMISQAPVLSRGGTPFNCDWEATRRSVEKLAALRPQIVAAGHGHPLVAGDLERFAAHFEAPEQGRYVSQPAQTDENGIVALPPKPADPFVRNAAIIGSLALASEMVWRRARRPVSPASKVEPKSSS